MAAGRSHSSPRVGRLSARFRIAALALIALALAGCGAPPDDDGTTRRRTARDRALTPAEQDSVRLLDEERVLGWRRDAELAAQLRPLLADWEEAWKRVIPGFQLDSLRWQKRDTLAGEPEYGGGGPRPPLEGMPLTDAALDALTQRRWKLLFTPDRWLAVDPEFGRRFDANGRLERAGGQPTVIVYDFRARRRWILAGADSSRPFEVTGWLGERRLVVAGMVLWSQNTAKTMRPAVTIYDLSSLHRTTGMGPPVSEPELEAHDAMLELLIRERSAPARRR